MSSPVSSEEGPGQDVFVELEKVVDAALRHLEEVTRRAEKAASRNAEFESLIKRFGGDQKDTGQVLHRLAQLESDNQDMRSLLEAGRGGVDSLIAKIRFLEEKQ